MTKRLRKQLSSGLTILLIVGSGVSCRPVTSPVADPIARAFEERKSDVRVEAEGTVTRTLDDDRSGSRHQRFIVRVGSGQTVLIQHNIDVAPRIDDLKVGDSVSFSGEYIWNEQGGLIHWTHHDPAGRHQGGWIKHNGRTYE